MYFFHLAPLVLTPFPVLFYVLSVVFFTHPSCGGKRDTTRLSTMVASYGRAVPQECEWHEHMWWSKYHMFASWRWWVVIAGCKILITWVCALNIAGLWYCRRKYIPNAYQYLWFIWEQWITGLQLYVHVRSYAAGVKVWRIRTSRPYGWLSIRAAESVDKMCWQVTFRPATFTYFEVHKPLDFFFREQVRNTVPACTNIFWATFLPLLVLLY